MTGMEEVGIMIRRRVKQHSIFGRNKRVGERSREIETENRDFGRLEERNIGMC